MNMSSGTPNNSSPNSNQVAELRWGGALLALGAVVFIAAIFLYVPLYGLPEGTGPGGSVTLADTAAHMYSRWDFARWLWGAEMIGALLIGLAASLLRHRQQTGRYWLPALASWTAVAAGALILTVMYALTLGSYPPALAAFQDQPAIFAALRGGMLSTFYIGMAVMFLGMAGAALLEALVTGSVFARWIAFVGGTVFFVSTVRWILMFAGLVEQLSPLLGLTSFLLMAVFGLSIWKGDSKEASGDSS